MSATLVGRGLSLSRGGLVVLEDVDVGLAPESRLGIVGSNGAGKTTLLMVLSGLVAPDAGSVVVAPRDAIVGYLPQEPVRDRNETVRAALARRSGVAAALSEFEAAAAALADGTPGADERYAAALDRYLRLGAPDFDARVAAVLDELELDAVVAELPTAALSGGQAARVSLAGVLLARFDVLLLDEPTNNLDYAGLERLERFVLESPVGIAVVSHDRAFLERTVAAVLELDDHSHRGRVFNGGWLSYLDERAVDRRHAEERYEEYRTRRGELEERARQQRQWAVSGSRKTTRSPKDHDRAQRDFFLNRTEKQAAKVRITEKALERLDVVEKPWEGWELRLEIESAPRSGDVVFRLEGACVERDGFVLGPIDLEVRWGDRLAILGANGSGKTTLLEALLGAAPLSAGSRYIGPSVMVGEFDQSRRRFTGSEPLLSVFEAGLPRDAHSTSETRALLAKFGLGSEHVGRAVSTLSPGERGRAVLASFMASGVNCLVLDEPTNHLDLAAIEQLERALDRWEGTLLLVSHDRRLLDEVRLSRTVQLVSGRVEDD